MRKETLNRFKKMFVAEKRKVHVNDKVLRDEVQRD